jgi:hypothetical protein
MMFRTRAVTKTGVPPGRCTAGRRPLLPHARDESAPPEGVDADEVTRLLREAIAERVFPALPPTPPPPASDQILAFLVTRPKSEWRSIATRIVKSGLSPLGGADALLRRLLERAVERRRAVA